jgi:hypothetical protein
MIKLIKRWLSKSSNPGAPDPEQDELIGCWENEDDGSGLHAMWGFGIKFSAEGEGVNYTWANGLAPEDREQLIIWKRNSEQSISIKFVEDEEWSAIEYEISDFAGGYGAKYHKLTEKGKETFWCSPEPLYKYKTT